MNELAMRALLDACKEQTDLVDLASDILKDFENYHKAIIDLEIYAALHNYDNTDRDKFREKHEQLDATRSRYHETILEDMRVLNRLADSMGLQPVYDGIVSSERPYRRQVADAVLEYLQKLIAERR